jgi:hypothetical protein
MRVTQLGAGRLYHFRSVFESDGAALVVDGLSIQYLDGATVDFVVEMVSESFQVRWWAVSLASWLQMVLTLRLILRYV